MIILITIGKVTLASLKVMVQKIVLQKAKMKLKKRMRKNPHEAKNYIKSS